MDHKKTILIVEDDEMMAVMESRVISRSNFNVIIAKNGLKAIEAVKNNPLISLILMDINLGAGMDGTETAVEILKIKELPIVFLTSHTEQEMVDKVKGITRYGYVLKNSGEFVIIESINMAFELFDAKELLKNSEEKYRTVVEDQTEVICRFHPDGEIIFVNDVFCRLLGKECIELTGTTWQTMALSDDVPFIESKLKNISSEKSVIVIENRIKTYSGEIKWMQFVNRGFFDSNGKLIEIQSVGRDVSERKKAEDALRESEERFRTIFEEGQIGISIAAPDFKFVNANHAFCQMMGYTVDELKNLTFKDITVSERVDVDASNINALIKGDISVYKTEKQYKKKNGEILWGKLVCSAVRDADDKVLYCIALVEDITDRKIAEQALSKSEERYRLITEIAADYFFKLKVEDSGEIEMVYVSDNFTQVTGRSIDDVKNISTWANIFYPDDLPRAMGLLKHIIDKGESETIECRTYIRGQLRWISIITNPQKDESTGMVKEIIGAVKDITERKKMEKELADIKSMLEAAFNQTNIPMVLVSVPDNIIRIANPASRKFLGVLDEPDYQGQSLFQFNQTWQDFDKDGSPKKINEMPLALALNGIETRDFECFIKRKDGTVRWELVSGFPIKNSKGEIIAAYIIFPDITERKIAESALRESEDKFKYVFDYSIVGKSITKLSGEVQVNKAFCDMLGYSEKEMKRYKWQDLTHPEDIELTQKNINFLVSGEKKFFRFVKRFIHKNGSVVWTDLSSTLRRDKEGKPLYLVTTIIDITEQKESEEKVKKLLNEHDLLLNEVHHRIKNDMNIISSMLSVQTDSTDDPVVKNILMESQSRIKVMYNVYNELYKKKDFSNILLKKYIIGLVNDIKYLYCMLSQADIEFDIDDISIDRKIIFPVGIIVNELVTNTFKYAFMENRDSKNNKIKISIKKNNENLIIIVSDNGKGYSAAALNNTSNGFGMQLINMLSEQFDGTMKIYNKDGAVCEFIMILKE